MGHHGARQLSPLFRKRPFQRNDRGGFDVHLDADSAAALSGLAPQFASLLEDPSNPSVARLFPPAYSQPGLEEAAEEYRRLMQADLVQAHRGELQLLANSANAKSLSEQELLAWVRALNCIRLVLGTWLGVSEDQERPRPTDSPEMHIYQWLTYLQGEAVEALAEGS